MTPTDRELTEDEMTTLVRGKIYNHDLFGQMMKIPGGDVLLRAQLARGRGILAQGVAVWGAENIAYARWAVGRINECLAMIRNSEMRRRVRVQAVKLREQKAALASIASIADFDLMLLYRHAFSEDARQHSSPDRADFQEVSIGLRKIFRKAGGKLPKEPSE